MSIMNRQVSASIDNNASFGGRKVLRLIVSVLVAFVGYGVWSFWVGAGSVADSVSRVPLTSFAIAIVLLCSSLGFRFLRWQVMLRELGHRLPLRKAILIYVAGFSLTTTPGKAGELIRGSLLSAHGVPQKDNVISFLGERLFDLAIIGMLASLILLHVQHGLIYLGLLALMLTVIVLLIRHFPDSNRFPGATLAHGIMRKVGQAMAGLRAYRHPKVFFQSLILGVLAWICLGGVLWVFVRVFAESGISAAMVISIYASALMVGLISLLPGGLGATELGMSGLLVGFGLNGDDAFVCVFLTRLICLWLVVAFGVIAMSMRRYTR